jgi:hypothetical protein
MGTETYEIRVDAHLDDHWSGWLGGFDLARLDDGTTTLTGRVVDQAQLHGILARIRDLGVTLLMLRTLDGPGAPATTPSAAGDRPRERGPEDLVLPSPHG